MMRQAQTGAPARTILLGIALLFAAAALQAQDPPHWLSTSVEIDCTSQCHVPHNSLGGGLNPQSGITNLCVSCHNDAGSAKSFSISNADKAIPGVSGTSHAFDVAADNAAAGAAAPTDPEMAPRVVGGEITCATCHDPHKSEVADGGTPRFGEIRQITDLGSTGDPAAAGTFSGPDGVWFLVEIVQAGNETNARFCYSKDNGLSWFPSGCNPPGTTSPNLSADGANPVGLDSGVSVTFASGNYVVEERWEFSAAYPFLRVPEGNAVSNICLECHGAWNVADAGTWTGNPMSHPVNVAIPAGDFHPTPLDGNGVPQGDPGDDSNPSNDLRLSSGNIYCLTCHGVHHADSNTLTEDGS